MSGPGVEDYLQLWSLRAAKIGRPKHGDAGNFYEGFFADKNIDESRYDYRHVLRRESIEAAVACLTNSFVPGRGPIIADIGSGLGGIIGALRIPGTRVGLAYAQNDLDLAQRLSAGGVTFLRGSAFELPFKSESVAVVLFLEVMEHLADDRAALDEIARVIKPSGLLVISVPGAYYFDDYLSLMGHYRHYTRERLVSVLDGAGFDVALYLDSYPVIQRAHFYIYMPLALMDNLLNRCGFRSRSMYVRPWVGPLYRSLTRVVSVFKRERGQQALAQDPRCTFLIARKRAA